GPGGADLSLLLDVMAGPDPIDTGVAYRLELPKARHGALKDFRILLIDTDPLLPTDKDVRGAIEALAAHLGKAGVTVTRKSPLLPDFAGASRIYFRILMALLGANLPPDIQKHAAAAA